MNLFKNTFFFALGNIGSKIINFAIYPLLTYYLLPEELGVLDLILTAIMIIIPIVTFNINSALFRFGIENPVDLNNYITNAIIINIAGSLFLIISFLLIWEKLVLEVELIVLLLYSISSIIYYFLLQLLRSLEKIKLFAFIGILSSFVLLIFLLILLEKGYGINSYFISSVVSHLICAKVIIFIIVKEKAYFDITLKSLNMRTIVEMLKYSVVLIPSLMLWWLIEASDRFMINYYISSAAVGIYAIASKFPSIITLINTFFIQAWEMKIYKKFLNHDRKKYYSDIFYCYFNLLVIIFAIFLVLFEIIFVRIINSEFHSSFPLMPILLLGAIFAALSSFIGTINLQLRRSKDLFVSSIFAGAANIGLNLLLIPKIGIFGAAISTAISYFILFSYRIYVLVKLKQLSFKFMVLLTQLISISSMLALYFYDFKFYLICLVLVYILISLNNLRDFLRLLLE